MLLIPTTCFSSPLEIGYRNSYYQNSLESWNQYSKTLSWYETETINTLTTKTSINLKDTDKGSVTNLFLDLNYDMTDIHDFFVGAEYDRNSILDYTHKRFKLGTGTYLIKDNNRELKISYAMIFDNQMASNSFRIKDSFKFNYFGSSFYYNASAWFIDRLAQKKLFFDFGFSPDSFFDIGYKMTYDAIENKEFRDDYFYLKVNI